MGGTHYLIFDKRRNTLYEGYSEADAKNTISRESGIVTEEVYEEKGGSLVIRWNIYNKGSISNGIQFTLTNRHQIEAWRDLATKALE